VRPLRDGGSLPLSGGASLWLAHPLGEVLLNQETMSLLGDQPGDLRGGVRYLEGGAEGTGEQRQLGRQESPDETRRTQFQLANHFFKIARSIFSSYLIRNQTEGGVALHIPIVIVLSKQLTSCPVNYALAMDLVSPEEPIRIMKPRFFLKK
jgi:hypothetical protein